MWWSHEFCDVRQKQINVVAINYVLLGRGWAEKRKKFWDESYKSSSKVVHLQLHRCNVANIWKLQMDWCDYEKWVIESSLFLGNYYQHKQHSVSGWSNKTRSVRIVFVLLNCILTTFYGIRECLINASLAPQHPTIAGIRQ